MPGGFQFSKQGGATIATPVGSSGNQQHRCFSGCRAGAQSQGGQLSPQHNAPDCRGYSMEPVNSHGVFVCGLFSKVAVMGRKGWQAMVFQLRDLLHGLQLDI